MCETELVLVCTGKEELIGEMVINGSLGCTDLEEVDIVMLREEMTERTKNPHPELQASILTCIHETSWWHPVRGLCPSAKKVELEVGWATKREFRNAT